MTHTYRIPNISKETAVQKVQGLYKAHKTERPFACENSLCLLTTKMYRAQMTYVISATPISMPHY